MRCHVKLSQSGVTCLRTDETDTDDSELEGRPLIAVNGEIAALVNECNLANMQTTIDEISKELDVPHKKVLKITADHLIFHKV